VSKDVLLIHVEKTLIFYDTNTQKEDILIVGSKSTPGSGADDNLCLEGIGCFDCCEIDLLALAEHPPISKVVICLYPALKVLATLIGKYGINNILIPNNWLICYDFKIKCDIIHNTSTVRQLN
jgi:hypothetical protein